MKTSNIAVVLTLAILPACGDHEESTSEGTSIDQGARFRAAMADDTDVDSFTVAISQVACPGQPAPLQPYSNTHALDIAGVSSGGGVIDDPFTAGTLHTFGQLNVPLEPGCYVATGSPRDAADQPSMDCLPTASVGFSVTADNTEELVLISNCPEGGVGIGDLAVMSNHGPTLSIVEGTTTTSQCGDLQVCFRAEDVDGDALEFVWTGDASVAISADPVAALQADGSWLSCATLSPSEAGQPQIFVEVYDLLADGTRVDEHPSVVGSSSASQALPLHVLPDEGACASIVYEGCFLDEDAPNRDLHGASMENAGMTISMCTDFCSGGGYRYAGVQAGAWCFCGDSHTKPPAENCDMACVGAPSENCGGAWANAIYDLRAPVYLGCFSDEDAPNRDLDGANLLDESMTINTCTEYCYDAGFQFAGLQDGTSCFCGDSHAKPPAENCDHHCPGEPETTCGGDWANQIYQVR